MRWKVFVIGTLFCLAGCVAAAMAQFGEPRQPDPMRPPIVEENQVTQLIDRWKNAPNDADREKVQKELREAVKAEFEARLAPQEEEVKQLEAKVQQLRKQLDRRRSKQDEIVDFRTQQLLREAEGLGWGTEPRANPIVYSEAPPKVETYPGSVDPSPLQPAVAPPKDSDARPFFLSKPK